MPLGAEFAKILQVARIDGHPRPRLVRTLLWLVGVIFGYQTVVWLSSLLLLVRATEQSSGLLPGQRASVQSEHYWGCVCRLRWAGFTGVTPLPLATTVQGIKGPLPFLLHWGPRQLVTGPEGRW